LVVIVLAAWAFRMSNRGTVYSGDQLSVWVEPLKETKPPGAERASASPFESEGNLVVNGSFEYPPLSTSTAESWWQVAPDETAVDDQVAFALERRGAC